MGKLNQTEIDKLFYENILEINKMDIGSGSMIKQIIIELEKQATFIRLKNPKQNGHSVEYEFLDGDREVIYTIANYLGFYKITENKMEVLRD